MTEYSYAEVVERMLHEFEDQHSLPVIVEVVSECREQLRGSPEAALPELLERLARQRLASAIEDRPAGAERVLPTHRT